MTYLSTAPWEQGVFFESGRQVVGVLLCKMCEACLSLDSDLSSSFIMTETDVHSKVILEKREAWQTFRCNPLCVAKISWCEIISSALLYKNIS